MSSPNDQPFNQQPPQYQQPPAYPPQMPMQPATPPKKRRSRLLIGCGGIVGLILLCGVIFGISTLLNKGGNSATPTVAAASTAVGTAIGAANPAASVAPTATTAGKATTSPTPTGASIAASVAPSTAPSPTSAPVKAVATVQVYKTGDTATVSGQKVTLNAVTQKDNAYIADVTVENTGTKQLHLSSLLSFDARDALGEQGGFSLDGSDGLDGTIEPSDKLRGTIAFSFPADATGIKLYYSAEVFSGQPTVFALDDAAAAQPFPPHPIAAQAKPLDTKVTYKAGAVIKVGDIIIQLENVSTQGTLITADLVAYNGGGKAASLSSLVSFTGQDSTGKKGDFKLPDKAGFDGTLLPGDSLRGQIRLEFDAGSTGHTLTYRPALFGGQAVKWSLD